MSTPRCVICDGARVATLDPEAAIAIVCMIAVVHGSVDTVKSTLCQTHRDHWGLLLIRGGGQFDEAARSTVIS